MAGYKDLDYGGLVSRYEAVVGKQGLWRTKQNRSLRESLFQGDEDGWTWIVTWTAPEGDQLWFAIGPIGGLVTREPDLVVRLLGTVLGPDGVRRFYEANRR